MMPFRLRRIAGLMLPLTLAAPGAAQFMPGPTPIADRLAEQVRLLAANPRDVDALITAGELSTRLQDMPAAMAFFARAAGIDPGNPRIAAGRAAAYVMMERPGEALSLFAQAERAGLAMGPYLLQRGLAYDLIGQPGYAQRDYRAVLEQGSDDEAIRRLALSLGIAGRRDEALAVLDPLLRRSDRAAWRARACILALAGDPAGGERIAASMMAGGQALGPFLRRLPALSPADRAFAVHFGDLVPSVARANDARLAPPLAPLPVPPVEVAAVAPAVRAIAQRPDPRDQRRAASVRRLPAAARSQPVEPVPAPPASPTPTPPVQVAGGPPAKAPLPYQVFTLPTRRPPPPRQIPMAAPPARPVPAPELAPVARRAAAPPSAAAVAASTPAPRAAPPPVAARPAAVAANWAVSADAPVPVPAAPVTAAASPPRPAPTPAPAPNAVAGSAPTPVTAMAVAPAPATSPERAVVEAPPAPVTPPAASAVVASASVEPAAAPPPVLAAAPEPAAPPVAEPAPVREAAPAPAAVAEPEAAAAPVPVASRPTTGLDAIIGTISVPAEELEERPARVATPVAKPPAAKPPAAKAEAKAAGEAKAAAEAKPVAKKAKPDPAKLEPARWWAQVAGGARVSDLDKDWRRLVAKAPAAFRGKGAWTTPLRATNRLLAGPFKSQGEAQAFVNAIGKQGLSAFAWQSEAGQVIARLALD